MHQPKQLVDRVHRLLHDVLHLTLGYVRVRGIPGASGALFSRMDVSLANWYLRHNS